MKNYYRTRKGYFYMTRLEELLEIIPDRIEHPILKSDWIDTKLQYKWTENVYPFMLRIEKDGNMFSATYVFTGFEGETQILPMTDSELNQRLEYGCVLEFDNKFKPTLEEALEDLLCWLRKTGNLK